MEPRNYLANASANPPAKPAAPSTGYPQAAVPGVNDDTVPGPYWFYKFGEELRAIITSAGITPSDNNLEQLLEALVAIGLSQATETFQGIVELATSAEVQAGTDTQRAITPAGLNSVFARSHSANGYQKLPGGLIIQWGKTTFSSGGASIVVNVTFPITFPTATLHVGAIGDIADSDRIGYQEIGITNYSVNYTNANTNGGTQNGGTIRWFAIGY